MTPGTITLNRWAVGVLAAGCFVAAVAIAVAAPREEFWWAGFLRAGVVLTALWFCLPTKDRPAAWADFRPLPAAVFAATLLLAVVRPKIGLPILLALIAFRVVFVRRKRSPARATRRG